MDDQLRRRDDLPRVPRPPEAATATAPHRPRDLLGTAAVGAGMGTADLVPGFSGGTVALITGIYPRLIANIRQGARAFSLLLRGRLAAFLDALRAVEWRFVLSLLVGLLGAVFTLATVMSRLLEDHPVQMESVFLGLIVGATILAWRELRRPAPLHALVCLGVGAVFFVLLGLRSGSVIDPPLAVYFLAGAIAICAMILPGISGSFLLLMLGMYANVIGAVSDRNLAVLVVFALGCAFGLAAFSVLLNWLLNNHHDLVLAAMIGLMVGSVRVLWPWPPHPEDGVGDVRLHAPVTEEVPLALGLGLAACLSVLAVGAIGRRAAART